MSATMLLLLCLGYFVFLVLFTHMENNLGYLITLLWAKSNNLAVKVRHRDHLSKDEYRSCALSALAVLVFLIILWLLGVDNILLP